jgi:hypothetical protein
MLLKEIAVRVLIMKRDANAVVAQYEINLRAANYRVTEREYYDEAWRCAVTDRLVDPNEHDLYWFKLEPPKSQM